MSKVYDTIDDFLQDLDMDVENILEDLVIPQVKEIVVEESQYIYSEYDNKEPNRFQLGMSGAFGDENSVIVQRYYEDRTNKGEKTIIAENIARARGNDYGEYLEPLIANGIYQYWYKMDEGASKPPSRPVMERAEERILREGAFDGRLLITLLQEGYELDED